MGGYLSNPQRPNYELYRMDKIVSQGEASYSGDLGLSIPLLTVPGGHGHDFEIKINYNSNITQRQNASWVGLGWSLDLGAVQRSVIGRADDQKLYLDNGNLGNDNLTGWRAEKIGRLSPNYRLEEPESGCDESDQADAYNLILDGSSEEILPFPQTLEGGTILSKDNFLPLRYKPWEISVLWDALNSIQNFALCKEDGTIYDFLLTNADQQKVEGKSMSGYNQSYVYPYRWNLSNINYPDGSKSKIKYTSSSSGWVERPLESIFIDRSYTDDVGNLFGAASPVGIEGKVFYTYSHPDTLYTDTHYAVFRVTNNPTNDLTDRFCKLDTIILYERTTRTELKRVILSYATQPNPALEYHRRGNYNDTGWVANTKLNNNQLTLMKITILSGGTEENRITLPPYEFTYYKNPKVNQQNLIDSSQISPGGSTFPGYYTDEIFATSWRLKNMTLPTGGKITYEYETYEVRIDPEGRIAPAGSAAWSYKASPRSRLSKKTVQNTIGPNQVWSYSYSPEVVYDSPSRPISLNYWPYAFTTTFGVTSESYRKYYRNCGIGHRWVKVTNPDATWKKIFYTSSYHGADASIMESQPDIFDTTASNQVPQYKNKVTSRNARRGLVWKEVTGNDSVTYSYSFDLKGSFADRWEYYSGTAYGFHYRGLITQISEFARLDTQKTVRDGILSKTSYDYYLGTTFLHGKTEEGNSFDRYTTYQYAYQDYLGMHARHQLSQLSGRSVFDNNLLQSHTSTKWALFNKVWLPSEEWEWFNSGDGIFQMAPNVGNVRVKKYGYASNSNVSSITDANGFTIAYNYSDNPNSPFQNTAGGLARGLITGVQRQIGKDSTFIEVECYNGCIARFPNGSCRLWGTICDTSINVIIRASYVPISSFWYDLFNNPVQKVDQNFDTLKYEYDLLGRISKIIGPSNKMLSEYTYDYATPNVISGKLYRSETDFMLSKKFYDGIGYEVQRLIANGDSDIISADSLDIMMRPSKLYRTYEISNSHNYDPLFDLHSREKNPNSGVYPYSLNQYYADGSNRLLHQHAAGSTFQDSNQNHYKVFSYGTNAVGDYIAGYAPNELFKTTVKDENGHLTQEFKDKFSNLVASKVDSGGNNLTTWMEYDVMGRIKWVVAPNNYPPAPSQQYCDTVELHSEEVKDSITFTQLVIGSSKYVQIFLTTRGEQCLGKEATGGITIWYRIKQYNNGNLIGVSDSSSLTDGPPKPGEHAVDRIVKLDPNTDMVKLLVGNVHSYCPASTWAEIVFKCSQFPGVGGKDIYYEYGQRGKISLKYSPDAGTTKYRYDLAGNPRFQQDANQTDSGKFTYQKYDSLNRVTEVGEIVANFISVDSITTGNDSIDYPSKYNTSKVLAKTLVYDTLTYTGQNNLKGRLSKSVAYRQGTAVLSTYYSYDDFGRVEWIRHQYPSSQDKKISYTYDLQGNVLKKSFEDPSNNDNNLYTFYEYDQVGRLSKVYTNKANSEIGKTKEAEYEYYPSGQVNKLILGSAPAQTIDYNYNERDWLISINNPDTIGASDKFAEKLCYYDGVLGSGAQYNGNIQEVQFNNLGPSNAKFMGYAFLYDGANRLIRGKTKVNYSGSWSILKAHQLDTITYDPNGNIMKLTRRGSIGSEAKNAFNYKYTPNKNRLDTLKDGVTNEKHTYGYNANGSVVSDSYRGIDAITYNINNLPISLHKTDSTNILYWYDANGSRIRKQQGTSDQLYILGADGGTEAVYNWNGTLLFWNIIAKGQIIGRIEKF
jgi:YD repeat-containing protein